MALLAGSIVVAAQLVAAPSAQAATGDLTQLDCLANAGAAGCTDLTNDSLADAASTVVSPDGMHVYVGSATSMSAFERNPNTGELTEAACWSNTGANGCDVLPIPVMDAVNNMTMSPDGKNLYASNYSGASGSIVVFTRNATTGDLTEDGCLANTNANGCTALANPSLNGSYDLTVSPDGKSLYVASFNTNSVTAFSRDTATGALTEAGCWANTAANGCTVLSAPALGQAWGVAVSNDGNNVYVTGSTSNAVNIFDRDPATGSLTEAGCLANTNTDGCTALAKPSLQGARFITVSPDDNNVYVTGGTSNSVANFQRDPDTGALTEADCLAVAGAAGCTATTQSSLTFARDVEVSPDGLNLYVTSMSRNNVSVLDRDPSDGSMTENTCFANTNTDGCTVLAKPSLADAMKLSMSPNGTDIYVASQSSNSVTVFSRAAAPTVVTGPATGVTDTAATLNGSVFANAATTTVMSIKYGTDEATVEGGGGADATVLPASATGLAETPVSATLSGLTPETTYFYRLSASNAEGTTNGKTKSFRTAATPVLVPEISITPTSLAFGDVVRGRSSGEQLVTVSSTGTAPLQFPAAAASLTGGNPGQFAISSDTCSTTTVAPGQSCTVGVSFSPTSTGDKAAALSMTSNASASQSVALTGTGTSAKLKKQKPIKPLNLPKRLKNKGWTKIVKVPVRTNAKQNAKVRVVGVPLATKSAGEVTAFRVVQRNGAIRVWLSGQQAMKVRVRIHAKKVPGYTSYTTKKAYRTKVVR